MSGDRTSPPALVYRTWGLRASPPLLLLHGFLGCSEDWEQVCQVLSKRFFCIAPDLPGHGMTAFSPARHGSFTTCAQAVKDLLDSLGMTGIPAIGYSMGGRLLLGLAVTAPGLFSRLVLESASPGIEDADARGARQREDEVLARRLECEVPRDFFAWWYGLSLFGDLKSCSGYRELLQRRLDGDPHTHARVLRALSVGSQAPLWDQLAGLTAPTLMVYGEHDSKYSDLAARMGTRGREITTRCVAGCGHAVHVEQPEDFAEICRSFFVRAKVV